MEVRTGEKVTVTLEVTVTLLGGRLTEVEIFTQRLVNVIVGYL